MSILWSLPSIAAVALVVIGPLGSYLGLLSPLGGFQVFLLGIPVSFLGTIALGGAGAFGALSDRPWRARAVRAAIVPALLTIGFIVLISTRSGPTEAFNDVSTDLADPPVFATGPGAGEPYPEQFLEWHRAAYPDLVALQSNFAPDAAFARALDTARSMQGWELVREDPEAGSIEAVATSRVFRFRDDVTIRVRPAPEGSLVDVRSRSRDGRGDLGANAARIEAYFAAFRRAG